MCLSSLFAVCLSRLLNPHRAAAVFADFDIDAGSEQTFRRSLSEQESALGQKGKSSGSKKDPALGGVSCDCRRMLLNSRRDPLVQYDLRR